MMSCPDDFSPLLRPPDPDRIPRCPLCGRIVMVDRDLAAGRWVRRDPNPDERYALIEQYGAAAVFEYGFSHAGTPGGPHTCDHSARLIDRVTGRGKPTGLIPLDLHRRPVRRSLFVVCPDCPVTLDAAGRVVGGTLCLRWKRPPWLVAPGFAQDRAIRHLLTDSEYRRYTIALGPADGTAGRHSHEH